MWPNRRSEGGDRFLAEMCWAKLRQWLCSQVSSTNQTWNLLLQCSCTNYITGCESVATLVCEKEKASVAAHHAGETRNRGER